MVKKIFLAIILFSFLILPIATSASIVPANCQSGACGISDFFVMLENIYDFIVKMIAAPLATIALIIGGVMMMVSAGNPSQFQKGKQILIFAIIGLVLAFGSYLIIRTLLNAMNYQYGI